MANTSMHLTLQPDSVCDASLALRRATLANRIEAIVELGRQIQEVGAKAARRAP